MTEETTIAPKEVAEYRDILWHSNAPWCGTGYGQQTALFAPRLQRMLGYRVAFSGFYGLRGSRIGWVAGDGQGFQVYPGGRDTYGNDVLGAHARHWWEGRNGMVLLLTDPWVIDARIGQKLDMATWVPIDHDPIISRTHSWLRESRAIPIAMSRFGERVMREAGHKKVFYVPHGFDPSVFKPMDRKSCRRALGIPEDKFVVGMVAANVGMPSRKCFSEAFQAFARFQREVPDALLYLHTKLESTRGENLPVLLEALELRVQAVDQYGLSLGMPPSVIATSMSAFDVLLNPSQGEGFGIPILEAQACGTPVISTDFSSMPEVAPVDAGNWCVGGEPVYTPFESWQLRPSVDELVGALLEAYHDDAKDERRKSVYYHAHENYQADHVTETHWKPVLEDAALEFKFRRQLLIKHGAV